MKRDERGGWVKEDGDHLAIGATRRLRALVATGYTPLVLGGLLVEAGVEPVEGVTDRVEDILESRCQWVSASDHLAICAVFAHHQMRPGPSPAARAEAKRRRWPVPFELDEDRIDDPEYAPRRAQRKNAFA